MGSCLLGRHILIGIMRYVKCPVLRSPMVASNPHPSGKTTCQGYDFHGTEKNGVENEMNITSAM